MNCARDGRWAVLTSFSEPDGRAEAIKADATVEPILCRHHPVGEHAPTHPPDALHAPPDAPEAPPALARRPCRHVGGRDVRFRLDRSLSSISHAWSSMCQAQRRIRNCSAHDRADSPRAWCSRIPSTKASR